MLTCGRQKAEAPPPPTCQVYDLSNSNFEVSPNPKSFGKIFRARLSFRVNKLAGRQARHTFEHQAQPGNVRYWCSRGYMCLAGELYLLNWIYPNIVRLCVPTFVLQIGRVLDKANWCTCLLMFAANMVRVTCVMSLCSTFPSPKCWLCEYANSSCLCACQNLCVCVHAKYVPGPRSLD